MNKRKETPDVLSEILGGDVTASETTESPTPPPAKPKRASKPRQSSTSQRTPKSPTRWDYQVVSFQYHHGWRPRFVNGAELADWTNGRLMHDFIANKGNDGWELTAACSGMKFHGLNDKYQLYFKRPKKR